VVVEDTQLAVLLDLAELLVFLELREIMQMQILALEVEEQMLEPEAMAVQESSISVEECLDLL
jgi:hypothetical protein